MVELERAGIVQAIAGMAWLHLRAGRSTSYQTWREVWEDGDVRRRIEQDLNHLKYTRIIRDWAFVPSRDPDGDVLGGIAVAPDSSFSQYRIDFLGAPDGLRWNITNNMAGLVASFASDVPQSPAGTPAPQRR